MKELEKKIIEVANSIPKTYGEYRLINPLYTAIARIMEYRVDIISGRAIIHNNDEHEKVRKIIAGMEKRGILIKSKSGMAYKMK